MRADLFAIRCACIITVVFMHIFQSWWLNLLIFDWIDNTEQQYVSFQAQMCKGKWIWKPNKYTAERETFTYLMCYWKDCSQQCSWWSTTQIVPMQLHYLRTRYGKCEHKTWYRPEHKKTTPVGFVRDFNMYMTCSSPTQRLSWKAVAHTMERRNT